MSDGHTTPAVAGAAGDGIARLEGVTRVYQQGAIAVHALKGIDLDIARGDFLALAGPSGSGKTTVLNLVGALDTPTAGRIVVDGEDLSRMDRAARARLRLWKIGFVFQAYNLIPVLTAYENAEFILLLRGVPPAERRERVMPLLAAVGLAGMEGRRPHELSGGQQQRVAVARAIAASPALVLADEPTANLDSATGAALLDLMRQLNHEHGVTFVFSTHDRMVMERARRVVHLHDGRIADIQEAAA
jgi:putative ABC transport system ATP-binding protein